MLNKKVVAARMIRENFADSKIKWRCRTEELQSMN